jgi:hypothetical protein
MQRMLPVELAILFKLELLLGIFPVFLCRIVLSLAFRALKSDQLDRLFLRSHLCILSRVMKRVSSPIGAERLFLP